VTFVAEAYELEPRHHSNTPILYLTSDSTAARIPDPSVGKVLAQPSAAVQITAQLLTPPNLAKPLVVQPLPSAIAVVSGGGRAARSGSSWRNRWSRGDRNGQPRGAGRDGQFHRHGGWRVAERVERW